MRADESLASSGELPAVILAAGSARRIRPGCVTPAADLELTTHYADWRTPQHDWFRDDRAFHSSRIWTHADTSLDAYTAPG